MDEANGTNHPERILVIANRTCPCAELLDVIRERAGEGTRVALVAPALNGRLAHAVSDTDGAVRDARDRLDVAVASLREGGVEVQGSVGDSDPLQAIDDSLKQFAADEVIIASWPRGRSHWLEKGVVEKARERYDVPVRHVVSEYGL